MLERHQVLGSKGKMIEIEGVVYYGCSQVKYESFHSKMKDPPFEIMYAAGLQCKSVLCYKYK